MVILSVMEVRFRGLDHNEIFEEFLPSPVSQLRNGECNSRWSSFYMVGTVYPQEVNLNHPED